VRFAIGRLGHPPKAGAENKPVIAALKRCATQNQVQYRVFPQPAGVKNATTGLVTIVLNYAHLPICGPREPC
jgi:hypothetical protein